MVRSQVAVPHFEVKSSTNVEPEKLLLSSSATALQQQHSMRRSKFSGELDRDMAPLPGSTRLSTSTPPLNPVTPLRWKSSKRLELEKKKLQEDSRAKEDKKVKPAAKDQAEKKGDHRTSRMAPKGESKDTTIRSLDDPKPQSPPDGKPSANGDLRSHPSSDEVHLREDSEASVDRKSGNGGDESAVVTIDSLRARLLAERNNSKAAKERAQQLSKKILELEARLDSEIQARKKAEGTAQQALLKCQSLGKHVTKEGPREIMEPTVTSLPDQAENTKNELPDPTPVKEANPIDDAVVESNKASNVQAAPSVESLTSDPMHGAEDTVPMVESASTDSGLPEQKRRFSGQERVRHMWDQMTEDMAALAQNKTQDDQEQVLDWMDQTPSVLQDIIHPKPPEDKKLTTDSSTKNAEVVPNLDEVQKPGTTDPLPAKGVSSRLKKVASLIERFEAAQENGHRESEHKQNSIGRRRSNENSTTQTHKIPGTHSPESHQEETPPKTVEAPKQNSHSSTPPTTVEAPKHNSHSSTPLKTIEAPKHNSHSSTPKTAEAPRHNSHSSSPSKTVEAPKPPKTVEAFKPNSHSSTPPKTVEAPKHNSHSSTNSLASAGKTTTRKETKPSAEVQTPKISIPLDAPAKRERIIPPANIEDAEAGSPEKVLVPSNFLTPLPHGRKQRASRLNLEDAHARDSRLHWDVHGPQLQHETLGSSNSQAGNSNAYIRPEVPGSYPLRDDEREIYRGRMESVSRSMEGLGHSYMSDPELGDEDMSESTRLHIPFQVPGGSGRSIGYQGESLVGTSQSFGAYPGREFPRRPSAKHENSATKVNEVLKALQLAKLSIQKTGARRSSMSNTCYSSNDYSTYAGSGRQHNLKTDYGFDGMTNRSPVAIRVWSHQELSRRYSTGGFRSEAGSPPRLQYSNSSASLGKYPEEDHPLAGRSSPVGSTNARCKFVDKISSGGGVQYFYPN